jgi:hypothetical protein
MTFRSALASGALFAATAAVTLTGAMAIPGVSSAQPYGDPYAQQACQQQQDNRAVTGAILGGLAGAALGNSVSRGNRTGGTVIGGVAGAAVGAGVGAGTTNCQADYPPPPGPPPGYYDNGAPPPPPGYGQNCGWAQRQLIFPDGTQARDSVEACQDGYGRWSVIPQ